MDDRMGRSRFIKRWLILIAAGVAVGIGTELLITFLPAGLGFALALLLLVCCGVPALALSIVWTKERLADAGRDEAWLLLLIVPIVNIAALVVFASLPPREDAPANRK